MGHIRGLIVLACLAALGGCGRKRSLEVPAPRPAAAKPVETVDRFYTADGKLKGSDVRVEWLELPLAFEKSGRDYERHRVFEAKGVGLEAARDFLSARMLTGSVEETRGDVYYRAVMAPSGGADAVRLNVRLTERVVEGVLRLDIERLTYDGVKPLPFEEAKRALAAEAKHAH